MGPSKVFLGLLVIFPLDFPDFSFTAFSISRLDSSPDVCRISWSVEFLGSAEFSMVESWIAGGGLEELIWALEVLVDASIFSFSCLLRVTFKGSSGLPSRLPDVSLFFSLSLRVFCFLLRYAVPATYITELN